MRVLITQRGYIATNFNCQSQFTRQRSISPIACSWLLNFLAEFSNWIETFRSLSLSSVFKSEHLVNHLGIISKSPSFTKKKSNFEFDFFFDLASFLLENLIKSVCVSWKWISIECSFSQWPSYWLCLGLPGRWWRRTMSWTQWKSTERRWKVNWKGSKNKSKVSRSDYQFGTTSLVLLAWYQLGVVSILRLPLSNDHGRRASQEDLF